MLWIFVLSIASSSDIGGMIVAMRFESIDLPDPGGPIMSRLWPPATGDFDRALHVPLPFYVAEIDVELLMLLEELREVAARRLQLRLTADELERLPKILHAEDVDARSPSRPRARSLPGTMSACLPRRRASIATGNTPFTGRTAPVSASSPTKLKRSNIEPSSSSLTAIIPSAIGRSKLGPSS
jgi:hypothetical protein